MNQCCAFAPVSRECCHWQTVGRENASFALRALRRMVGAIGGEPTAWQHLA